MRKKYLFSHFQIIELDVEANSLKQKKSRFQKFKDCIPRRIYRVRFLSLSNIKLKEQKNIKKKTFHRLLLSRCYSSEN